MFNSVEGRGRRQETQRSELGAGQGITAVLSAKRWLLGAPAGVTRTWLMRMRVRPCGRCERVGVCEAG